MGDQYQFLAYGATHLTIYFPDIQTLRVPLPPIDEQRQIARFLKQETAKIDALVDEQRRLIELLTEKRRAVISHAVTKGLDPDAPMKPSGIDWLGEVPEHWEVVPLKRICSVIDCKHITAEFQDEGWPLASIREVQSKWVCLDEAKRTTESFYEQLIDGGREPVAGDLIFSRNATVGLIAQVPESSEPFAMGQDVCLLKRQDDTTSSDFIQAVMGSDVVSVQLDLLIIGSTFKRVNVEEIRGLLLPTPPSIEQRAISAYVDHEVERFSELEEGANEAIQLLQERRTALISAAVTGKIDVRGTAPADAHEEEEEFAV